MGFFAELKRRNVFRVAIAYGVLAWLLAQVADLAFDNFGAPDWVSKSVLFILILGFPIAVFFAWAFELTPEGIKREKDIDRAQSITSQTGRKLDFVIIGVLVVAVGFLLIDRFRSSEPVIVDTEVITTEFDRSIAVLPFENRSDRSEDEYFTEGIHDDLLTTMANIGSMRVISRTSVMEYKGTTKKIPEIARELGVANILEGGVQRAGNKVRINVQLIDANTDEHLWAQIYDRELSAENLFDIQSEVSNAIADALHATLSPEESERVSAVPTRNLEAYELYLRGRQQWMARTTESTDEAVRLFTRATEIDPDYAEAWAGLGDAYRHQAAYGGRPGDEVFPESEKAIRKALELNDQLAEAHAALGGLKSQIGLILEARQHLERAIELKPNYSSAYNWLGLSYNMTGDFKKALQNFERGIELDPLYTVLRSNIGSTLSFMGRLQESKDIFERIVDASPEMTFGHSGLASYYNNGQGRLDLGLPHRYREHLADPEDPAISSNIANIYLMLGDAEAGNYWIEVANSNRPDNPNVKIAESYRHIVFGNHDSARNKAVAAMAASPFSGYVPFILYETVEAQVSRGAADQLPVFIEYHIAARSGDVEKIFRSSYYYLSLGLGILAKGQGNEGEAHRIASLVLETAANDKIMGPAGIGPGRAMAYMLLDEHELAKDAMQEAVDAGWRMGWQWYFDQSDIFAPLRDDPRFQALRMRVASDMSDQLENVRQLEAAGEIGTPRDAPRSSAPPI